MNNKEKRLVAHLKKRGMTITTAESCTGGMIASDIISVDGASDVIKGAFVTYSDEMKVKELGVKARDIKKYSAVSSRVAYEMAMGAKAKTGANVALATTGYAGPTGELVGLVYIAVCVGSEIKVYRFKFKGGRQRIRRLAADTAMCLVIKEIGKR
ncbi:MAG: CinA family protein [Ruminococcaceae bacterium]|nr:CinA family protein [Oscillospiraceae bacterium]